MNIGNIDILGDQEETLGTAEDLTEEISMDTQIQESLGSRIRIEFETSRGFCVGYYTTNDVGHEELTMEPESVITLTSLFPAYYGAYINALNRDWVDIDLSEKYDGCPEYKIYNRTIETGSAQ
ncbi:hypothetical protein [Dyadobacter psychrotolerans]|uniref:Uncharacterized protein n=1 Tax=Dyadobacter psychrotolerans TaxID=2541721 RepID=A0A4R5DE39_9BACT|nr:hypothetical protein [Dyadobacter psychrotolerans]TDE12049.1 hypothetical protein E0F88_23660 [Dyadobacter psychrotolerans]